MLRRGINVAVGTDSCASSPDLNLVDELRLLHRLAPEMPALALWEMATTRAARAIGQESQVGSIHRGQCADFAVFPVRSSYPLTEILENDRLPLQVWSAGQRVPPRPSPKEKSASTA
jgi:cytosine/adenosine deaminase-related metal-dependent hydrolase